ncbi:unnamed protein product [Owenia fusiformis]|uniref:Uncharacterized protein n=1 Tax=Owenia fusiformis TaxID=6347 RepID=A0A8J1UZ25_OWEFU|nr:unnamed protein product [Owenia fusiformis]
MDNLLRTVECTPRYEIVEQLPIDNDVDMLYEVRSYQFSMVEKSISTLCEDRFGPQTAGGEDQMVDLKLKRRKGDTKLISYANDIYDMYVYLMGLTDHFPRSILAPTSVLSEEITSRSNDLQRSTVRERICSKEVIDSE